MGFKVEHDYFTAREDAVREIEAAGLLPSDVDAGAQALDTHWHAMDLVTYVLVGGITITEEGTGEVFECGPGAKITAEARTLHSEKTDGLTAVVCRTCDPEKDDGPFIRPPEEL